MCIRQEATCSFIPMSFSSQVERWWLLILACISASFAVSKEVWAFYFLFSLLQPLLTHTPSSKFLVRCFNVFKNFLLSVCVYLCLAIYLCLSVCLFGLREKEKSRIFELDSCVVFSCLRYQFYMQECVCVCQRVNVLLIIRVCTLNSYLVFIL